MKCPGGGAMNPHARRFGVPELQASPLRADREVFWRPSSSKFDGRSHVSNACLRFGHSASVIENHAVSLLRPLTIMCCRKTPSKAKPNRRAALLDAAFSALHFHSNRL